MVAFKVTSEMSARDMVSVASCADEILWCSSQAIPVQGVCNDSVLWAVRECVNDHASSLARRWPARALLATNYVGDRRWMMLVPVLHIEIVHLSGQRVECVLMMVIHRGLTVDLLSGYGRRLLGLRRLLGWLVGLVGLDRLAARHHAWGARCWRWRKLCGIRVVSLSCR